MQVEEQEEEEEQGERGEDLAPGCSTARPPPQVEVSVVKLNKSFHPVFLCRPPRHT